MASATMLSSQGIQMHSILQFQSRRVEMASISGSQTPSSIRMTHPTVLRLVEEFTEASTLSPCKVGVEGCVEWGAVFVKDQRVSTFPELPKEGGEENIPRDKMSLNKFPASKVGEDPRCGACGKEGWNQLGGNQWPSDISCRYAVSQDVDNRFISEVTKWARKGGREPTAAPFHVSHEAFL
ncbi:hypothetical protein V6N11_071849 [Hibiscus sabdariffa]|uniref:Uncharacterized protein n=1 Tax=Hibiscus sabdariffa TaxID=183260 RepID=A0ABR2U1C9_9ROSI